jgi:hypothetical protein
MSGSIVPHCAAERVAKLGLWVPFHKCILPVLRDALAMDPAQLNGCVTLDSAARLIAWHVRRFLGDVETRLTPSAIPTLHFLFMRYAVWSPSRWPAAVATAVKADLMVLVAHSIAAFDTLSGIKFKGRSPRSLPEVDHSGACLADIVIMSVGVLGVLFDSVMQGVMRLGPDDDAVLELFSLACEGSMLVQAWNRTQPVIASGIWHGWARLTESFVPVVLSNAGRWRFTALGPAIEGKSQVEHITHTLHAMVFWHGIIIV